MKETQGSPPLKLVSTSYGLPPLSVATPQGSAGMTYNGGTQLIHDSSALQEMAVLMNAEMAIEMAAEQEIREIDLALERLHQLTECPNE